MREIKFRAWNIKKNIMLHIPQTIQQLFDRIYAESEHTKDLIFLQYTGLKDMNNKEIYEGDIVKFQKGLDDYIAVVEWHPKHCALVLVHKTMEGWSSMINDCKIIGNIFENPLLLKNETKPAKV